MERKSFIYYIYYYINIIIYVIYKFCVPLFFAKSQMSHVPFTGCGVFTAEAGVLGCDK